jgi:hypothetical protein
MIRILEANLSLVHHLEILFYVKQCNCAAIGADNIDILRTGIACSTFTSVLEFNFLRHSFLFRVKVVWVPSWRKNTGAMYCYLPIKLVSSKVAE